MTSRRIDLGAQVSGTDSRLGEIADVEGPALDAAAKQLAEGGAEVIARQVLADLLLHDRSLGVVRPRRPLASAARMGADRCPLASR